METVVTIGSFTRGDVIGYFPFEENGTPLTGELVSAAVEELIPAPTFGVTVSEEGGSTGGCVAVSADCVAPVLDGLPVEDGTSCEAELLIGGCSEELEDSDEDSGASSEEDCSEGLEVSSSVIIGNGRQKIKSICDSCSVFIYSIRL